ncbi:hypothetical protein SAMN05192551_101516 [Tindallia magadiensis]|uniref:Uncharacterized protein n=1 Tax=Tindallia magadiensis TaxID=69895 RepID=A0A1I3B0W3_9FIRM|nr:hypothetical protein SAMN05192551_101516 [Tindallia magadiensis]
MKKIVGQEAFIASIKGYYNKGYNDENDREIKKVTHQAM